MSDPEELLAEAKARLADIALGAKMILETATGAYASYAREVLRVSSACLDPRCGDEGRLCEEHAAEAAKEYEYLRDAGPPEGSREYEESLRDAGRGHLLR